MEKKKLYLIVFFSAILPLVSMVCWLLTPVRQTKLVPQVIESKRPVISKDAVNTQHFPAIKIPKIVQGVSLKIRHFNQLSGWGNVHLKPSFDAFQLSCRSFLRDDPEHQVGSRLLPIKAKDWYPACQAATQLTEKSEQSIREFFESWFTPVQFERAKPVEGLFTGYYVPLLEGSLKRSETYSVPIYASPPNLITANLASFSSTLPHRKIIGYVSKKHMLPFYSRAEINRGAIARSTQVLAWVKNEIDRLILETEGSGVVQLKQGKFLALGYASSNGGRYRSLASLSIAKGYMHKDEASMQHIRAYFAKNPNQLKPLIEQNQSFVFFRKLPNNQVFGSQGIPLSPGYSMAVDRQWIPMGVPLWLSTTLPQKDAPGPQPFNRLFVAQDTGGSIRGMVRGDIYWGPGQEATYMGTQVESHGTYCLLIPSKHKTV